MLKDLKKEAQENGPKDLEEEGALTPRKSLSTMTLTEENNEPKENGVESNKNKAVEEVVEALTKEVHDNVETKKKEIIEGILTNVVIRDEA